MSTRRALVSVRQQVEPRGLAVPLRVDPAGRAVTVSGAEHDRSLLKRALSDCSNTNPFRQGIGFGVDLVLRQVTPARLGIARARARRIIGRDFRGRLEFVSASASASEPGVMAVDVEFRSHSGHDRLTLGGSDR